MSAVCATGRTSPRRRGFVMVTMICSLVILMAFLGLSIDVGYEEYVKTRMQTAADAAAVGAVNELRASGAGNLEAAAKADAAANGFTHGRNSVSVTVNRPPATGYSAADAASVEVIISQNVPTFFMVVLGISSGTVQARAVAHLGSGTSCVYALDPAASGAFSASGGASVQMSCGLMVDSSSSSALTVSGGASVTANYIGIAGGFSSSGGAVLNPGPTLGVLPENDPFAQLPKPSVGACDFTNTKFSGGATGTLNPGTYCKGISISGGSSVTFHAGTYILGGGGLSVSGNSSISGTGVTFYNTTVGSYGYQAISISGGTAINLSAPTTGSLAGILFFQDPAVVSGSNNSISGGATTVLNGALYFPTTSLDYSGGAAGAYTIIVAKSLKFSGGTALHSDYSSLPKGSPIRSGATLSE